MNGGSVAMSWTTRGQLIAQSVPDLDRANCLEIRKLGVNKRGVTV
jgi:hypothetical protein